MGWGRRAGLRGHGAVLWAWEKEEELPGRVWKMGFLQRRVGVAEEAQLGWAAAVLCQLLLGSTWG